MANTTDMIITCFGEDFVVEKLSKDTGVDFIKMTEGSRTGGSKVLIFESYGACYRSLGEQKITEIISAFRLADFQFPELAVLIIDDDNEVFSGIVLATTE